MHNSPGGVLYFAGAVCYHCTMKNDSQRVMDLAYIRDGHVIHTDESVILACLLHTKGKKSKDFVDVQKIMKDVNLEEHKNRKKD